MMSLKYQYPGNTKKIPSSGPTVHGARIIIIIIFFRSAVLVISARLDHSRLISPASEYPKPTTTLEEKNPTCRRMTPSKCYVEQSRGANFLGKTKDYFPD